VRPLASLQIDIAEGYKRAIVMNSCDRPTKGEFHMSSKDAAPVPARPAATVIILRDGPEGIEVFMVERRREIEFA